MAYPTSAEVDAAIPSGGEPNRVLTSTAIKSIITESESRLAGVESGKVATDDPRLTDSRVPTGAAGGVLSGSYPNPSFAVDMATQAELDAGLAAKLNAAEKGANSGVAPLDSSGKVPLSYLNVSGLSFMGAWDASNNTPTLTDGVGNVGNFYKSSSAGVYNFGNGSYTFAEGDWVIFAGGTWQRIGVHESVVSVNGKIGMVNLTASDVNALPSSYTPPAPTWASVTNKPATFPPTIGTTATTAKAGNYQPTWAQVTDKPDLDALYAPKRVLIHERVFNSSNTEVNTLLGSGYAAYDKIEIEYFSIVGSTGSTALHVQVRDTGGTWRTTGYVCRTTGNLDPPTQSLTAFTIIPDGIGASVLCNGIITVRKNGLPVISNSTYGDNYRNCYGRLPVDTFDAVRVYFNAVSSSHYITGGTARVYGIKN